MDAEETECILPCWKPFSTLDKKSSFTLSLHPCNSQGSGSHPLFLLVHAAWSTTGNIHTSMGMHTHWRGSFYPASKAKSKKIIISLNRFFFLLEVHCVVTGTMTHGWIQQFYKPLPFPPELLHLQPKAAQSWGRVHPVLSPDDSFLPLLGYSSYPLLS